MCNQSHYIHFVSKYLLWFFSCKCKYCFQPSMTIKYPFWWLISTVFTTLSYFNGYQLFNVVKMKCKWRSTWIRLQAREKNDEHVKIVNEKRNSMHEYSEHFTRIVVAVTMIVFVFVYFFSCLLCRNSMNTTNTQIQKVVNLCYSVSIQK